jgi:8-oxo-dGTP pyrophosphatase MutT (NUDIX family)
VDEDDKELGSVSRKDSMLRSLWHRSTGIMVINSKGEILVHKRAAKIKFPYYYDMFFGGYVSYGESYDENAKRELFEEAGIVADPVFLFKSKNDDPESRSHFQIYQVKSDGPFRFQEDEVEKGFFVSMEVLKDMVRKEKFTPGSLSAFGTYLKGFYKNGKR